MSGGFWPRTERQLGQLGELLLTLASLILLLMVLLMGAEIAARAIFRTSTQIADEYSGYLFTWMTMCGFVHAQRSDRFLRVNSLRSRLSPRMRAGADAMASLLAMCVIAVLIHATWFTFKTSFAFDSRSIQPSQTLLWIPQIIMPVGLGLLFLGFAFSACHGAMQVFGRLPLATPRQEPMATYE